MLKIYTQTGDGGTTALWDGSRVSKDDPHIETNGALDELNAAIGLAKSFAPGSMKDELDELQNRLVALMSYVARGKRPQASPDSDELERWVDRTLFAYPLDKLFVNPGATTAGAALHLARSIARRAERAALPIRAENGGDIEAAAYSYLNRLSDLLFVLAHKADCLGAPPPS